MRSEYRPNYLHVLHVTLRIYPTVNIETTQLFLLVLNFEYVHFTEGPDGFIGYWLRRKNSCVSHNMLKQNMVGR